MSERDRKLSVGVIGLGMQGHGHLVNLASDPRVELRAVCDINPETLQEQGDEFDVDLRFKSYEDLIAAEEVDAVVIVLPDHLHRDVAVMALKAGKDVLLEKPMALTVEDAEAIAAADAESDGCFMLNLSNRWMYTFSKGKERIDEGEVGEVRYVFARLANRIDVPTQLLPWLQHSHVAHWIGVHRLDIARWWIGREVRRVRAVQRRGILAERGIDVPDFYQATIEFEGGAVLSLEGNWVLPTSYPSLVDSRFYALCSDGVIDVDRMRSSMMVGGSEGFDMATPTNGAVHGQAAGFTYGSSRHFVGCALEGREPMVGAKDGVALTRTLCALVESAEADGKVMELSR